MDKSKKIKQLRNEKGITLIALVITIIILIILAGVSINILFDSEGLINKAKKAAENMEIAQVEEQEMLNDIIDSIENLGQIKTVEEMRTLGTYMPSKTALKDSDGNLIKVPEGFKIASDSGLNVTEGIVIEDNDIKEGIGNNRGNQYVWIPVGENIKKSDGTEIDITLGRYDFANGLNYKDEEGNFLTRGTPILKQSAENYEEVVTISSEYQELAIARDGVASSGSNGLNTTALNLKGFIDSVKTNGGYYIARYEASYGEDGKVNSKVSIGNPSTTNGAQYAPTEEGCLWNNVTQVDAAKASRNLYTTINSDLMNSYAWNTAIVYIQAFSGDTDYSRQTSKNTNLANTGVNSDEVCKINDIASNTLEWTTEYSTHTYSSYTYHCTGSGGYYSYSSTYPSYRWYFSATTSYNYITFRSALYM